MKSYLMLYWSFFKIGAFMFGGGYSMLPLLTRELVDKRGWTTEEKLLDYFAIAQCTPGIIAVNTATFVGHDRKGILGAVSATLGVVTVPIILIILIATALSAVWDSPVIMHAFNGIRAAVAALIASAVVRLFRSSVKDWFGIVLCLLAFAAIAFLDLSPILAVLTAGILGIVYGRLKKA